MMDLTRMRERRGLSQPELARRSGVSQQVISQVEKDPGRCPRIDTVYALSVALRCSMYDLYVPDGRVPAEETEGEDERESGS